MQYQDPYLAMHACTQTRNEELSSVTENAPDTLLGSDEWNSSEPKQPKRTHDEDDDG